MSSIDTLKDNLIDRLWLPKAQEARSLIYPRRRQNAKMKLLTLNNGINLNEIIRFEEANLIQREDSVAWIIEDFTKRMRLEAENIENILEGDILLESILNSSSQIQNHFPFDILNLDFSSQELMSNDNRLEHEIGCLESILCLQKQNDIKKLVLFYTTIIDSTSIEKCALIEKSDSIQVEGWDGLDLHGFGSNIVEFEEKKNVIQRVLTLLCQKYGYSDILLTDLTLNESSSSIYLYSVALIVKSTQ